MKLSRFVVVSVLAVTFISNLSIIAVHAETQASLSAKGTNSENQTVSTETDTKEIAGLGKAVDNKEIEKNVQITKAAQDTSMTYEDWFPDENLALAVSESFGEDVEDEVSEEKLAELTVLECGNYDIEDTSGIEYLTGLTFLNAYANLFTTIDLSKNTKLVTFFGEYGSLTGHLDLSNNPDLRTLDFADNYLTSIDVSASADLTRLDLRNNKLTSIDVNKNPALTSLYVQGNQLKDISTIPDNVTYNATSQKPVETKQIAYSGKLIYTLPADLLDKFGNPVEQITPGQGGVYDGNTRTITWTNLTATQGDLSYSFMSEDGLFTGTMTIPYQAGTVTLESASEISYEEGTSKTEAEFLKDIDAKVTPYWDKISSDFMDVVDFAVPGDYLVTLQIEGTNVTKKVNVHITKTPVIIESKQEISYEEGTSKTETEFLTDIDATVTPDKYTITTDFTDVVDFTTPGDYTVTLSVKGSDVTKKVIVHIESKSAVNPENPVLPGGNSPNSTDKTTIRDRESVQSDFSVSESEQQVIVQESLPKTGDTLVKPIILVGVLFCFAGLYILSKKKKA
ncbi:LapB repeat-containing protein [Listeria ivanovii]|uniref:LapB repeat-containing protein n=1 Tax=Listeria ivanovii TaxID=1638 RepID=UPI0030CCD415